METNLENISMDWKKQAVKELMENYPECSSPSVRCVGWEYNKMIFYFNVDQDTSITRHKVTEEMLLKGLDILLDKMKNKKYFNNGPINLSNYIEDLGCWDGNDVDALVQCALFGDILYG
jgi:hypothetical protein